jgi:hypothetical protein
LHGAERKPGLEDCPPLNRDTVQILGHQNSP